MKKFPVTGATSDLWAATARSELVDAGHSVRVLVRSSSNPLLLQGMAVERVEGDLRDVLSSTAP